jgi:hypothetical protein
MSVLRVAAEAGGFTLAMMTSEGIARLREPV